MKLTFVTVSATAVKQLSQVYKEIEEKYEHIFDLRLYYAVREIKDEKRKTLIENIKSSDLVFIDLMGSPASYVQAVYEGLENCKGNVVPYGGTGREYMKLGKFTMGSMASENKKVDMEAIKKMQSMAEAFGKVLPGKVRDMRNYSYIIKYFKVARKENILNMLYLILREYGNIKNLPKPSEPLIVEEMGICDPKDMIFYENLKDYNEKYRFYNSRPTIVILFYGHTYPTDTSKCVNGIKSRLEEFANVIPIAISSSCLTNKKQLQELIVNSINKKVDLIINFMSFRLGAGPMGGKSKEGTDFLVEMDVPYLHPFFMTRRTKKDWEESIQGSTASEMMISVMLPELDGCIETYPVAAMSEPKYDGELDIILDELELIDERVDRLISKIKGHLKLREKENKNKKVAIICYNYPPGEGNLFGGAFLDTFSSVSKLLENLKESGYDTEDLSKDKLMSIFTGGKIVNSGKYDSEDENFIRYSPREYEKDLKEDGNYKEMLKQWGQVPGTIMVSEDEKFLIPGIVEGNIFIGLQPSRGIHEDDSKVYHDKELLPHHQYQGFYRWIREEFKADAIIHVGTHGTLEFLKGKECGISKECYADKLLGEIPHLYLYYCGNPSEGTIAKRRSNANLIGYQPPVFVQGEIYGEYVSLMTLIDNYNQALALSPQSGKSILESIKLKARELNMSENLEDIESELYRMNTSLIPKGLHVFGEKFSEKEALEYVTGVLRYNKSSIISLRTLVGRSKGYEIDTLLEKGEYKILRAIDIEMEISLKAYIDKGNINSSLYENNSEKEVLQTLNYGKKLFKKCQENHEIEGMLHALEGKYNEAKLAGDIYRNPEVLPCGYNLYQFDPRLIPTRDAFKRGKTICESTIKTYKDEKGEYPISTAVILWGLETSRTQGETFSQILNYLGIKIQDKLNIWEPKYEIIPMEELGRPRIDVTINICGFFRDMFPNLIDVLQDVFNMVYDLDESDEENYFKANSKKIYKELIKEGYDKKEAKELSISRIFGPKEGQYGTGITGIVETKSWIKEEELGDSFLDNLQYVYNGTMRGKKVEDLYKKNLKSVEIVSQIRSNHEYEITDLDHYYEFFGGLSKSVEMVKGKKAKMYITDTTLEKITTDSIQKSIAHGIRTRVLNPKWIDGMLQHKYHGTEKIADRFENIMGLSATTNSVDQWIYDDMHTTYVEDENLSKRLKNDNPYAYMNMLEQMMEYYNRGYWKASEEQIEKLKERYLEIEDNIEELL